MIRGYFKSPVELNGITWIFQPAMTTDFIDLVYRIAAFVFDEHALPKDTSLWLAVKLLFQSPVEL